MDELYQMIIFALKHYDNWKDRTHLRKVDLAPSKNISSLSYTKSMGLSLSPPQAAELKIHLKAHSGESRTSATNVILRLLMPGN